MTDIHVLGGSMQLDPRRRRRRSWVVIVICALIVAAGGAALTGWRISSHPVTLQRASCGSAATHFLTGHTQVFQAGPGSLTCFTRAARDCNPASIGINELGEDSGTDYVFIITPAKPSCQVTEQRQDYSANFGGSHGAVISQGCRRVAVTASGVTLSCRGRDVLVPARVG
jgi:hypothetical protein